jgi:hypothetical protein
LYRRRDQKPSRKSGNTRKQEGEKISQRRKARKDERCGSLLAVSVAAGGDRGRIKNPARNQETQENRKGKKSRKDAKRAKGNKPGKALGSSGFVVGRRCIGGEIGL